MGNITDIGNQYTPATPVEITFAAILGTPSDIQSLTLIGHRGAGAASGSSGIANYSAVNIVNAGSASAASGEAAGYFGAGSELAAMVVSAVTANQNNSVFPPILAIPLANSDTDFGGGSAPALVTAERYPGSFLVMPYDGSSTANFNALVAAAELMSGPSRVSMQQFGTFAWAHIRATTNPASLPDVDSYNAVLTWMPDSAPVQLVGQIAAAGAAWMAGLQPPFNPQDGVAIPGVAAPVTQTDWIQVGSGLASETALMAGSTPLQVLPNGGVAFVRTITTRLTLSGVPVGQNYIDVQDFQVLFYWRQTVATRLGQPDIKNQKASATVAQLILGELIRLADLFQDNQMFQGVDQAAKNFIVQRNTSDRSRFDVLTPVDVIPGLHEVATNIQATTAYDQLTI